MLSYAEFKMFAKAARRLGLKSVTVGDVSFEFFAPALATAPKAEKTDDKPKQPPRKNLLDAALDAELE